MMRQLLRTRATGVEGKSVIGRRQGSQCILGVFLHWPLCSALLVKRISLMCFCLSPDGF